MAAWRLSRLQQQILRWLAADYQRTRGMIVSSHADIVKTLAADKGNLSHSLRTLEKRGWIVIGRSPGGKAQYVTLTSEGSQRASEIGKKLRIRYFPHKTNGLSKVVSLFNRGVELGLEGACHPRRPAERPTG
jgi:DNA-binding MarR family transcriptional regulator